MPNPEQLKLWHAASGDQTLRLAYDLNEESIVFDLGGYKGNWTDSIFQRYHCFIHIFEPVGTYLRRIMKRFTGNGKIFSYQFGLASVTKRVNIAVAEDASSIYKKGENNTRASLVNAKDFFNRYPFRNINLMKINVEGGEYDLLETLLKMDYIKNIDNIQVQFHDFIPEAERRMAKIHCGLQKTHDPTYQYKFVWENWRKR